MAEPSRWNLDNETLTADCRVFKVYKQKCSHPRDKRTGDFFVLQCPDWVMALPVTHDGKIVLVRQYRMGTRNLSWEPPGGILDPGENPVEAAVRELREETGYAGAARFIGKCSPNPALMDNTSHFVLVENCELVGDTEPDENEEIETRLFDVREAEQMVLRGEIHHVIALAALWHFRQARPDLF